MTFRARAAVATVFVLALGAATRSQASEQTSPQPTAAPADDDIYALRGPAAAGDAKAQ